MRTFKEKQRVDRELFSELTESLVNPAVVFDALQCKLRRIGYVVLCCHLLSEKVFTEEWIILLRR